MPVPLGRTTEIPPSQSEPRQLVNRIHLPLALKRGEKSSQFGSSGVS